MTPQETEVWNVIRAFNDAFAANDVERYFTYMDEDLVVIVPHSPYRIEGIAPDREGFEYSLKIGSGRVGYFQALQPLIRVYGDTAVVTYYSRGSYGADGQAKTAYYKETDVLVHRVDGWKIAHIHVSATGQLPFKALF
jgi:ketosteroid isomerase-like protein